MSQIEHSATSTNPIARKRLGWAMVMALALFAALILLWFVVQFWPVALEVGPETTVLTGPLRPDGTVDYVAAVNARCAAGVTPENNAEVLLRQAFGPSGIDPAIASEYFRQLGIPELPPTGNYLTSIEQFYSTDPAAMARANEHLELATSQAWTASDFPELARWLAANEKPLELVETACRRERFYSPIVVPGNGSFAEYRFYPIHDVRMAARLLAVRTTLHDGSRQIDAALEDSETVCRLSRHLASIPFRISALVSWSIFAQLSPAESVVIESGLVSADQARRQRAVVQSLRTFPSVAEIEADGERYYMLDQLQAATWTKDFEMRRPPDINVTLRQFNVDYADWIRALSLSDRQVRRVKLRKCSDRIRAHDSMTAGSVIRMIANPRVEWSQRAATRLAVMCLDVAENSLDLSADRHTTRLDQFIVATALAEYRAIHGEFPEKLIDLVPGLLESVPADPFSLTPNDPLRYFVDADRNRFRLYSVGPNGIDNRGLHDPDKGRDDFGIGTATGD